MIVSARKRKKKHKGSGDIAQRNPRTTREFFQETLFLATIATALAVFTGTVSALTTVTTTATIFTATDGRRLFGGFRGARGATGATGGF